MQLKARHAVHGDLELYFLWANDPLVRQHSFQSKPISKHEHQDWFSQKLQNDNSYLYVIEGDGVPIGQVRFERDQDDAWIAYMLAKELRGKNLGHRLLQAAIEFFLTECKTVLTLKAKVKSENHPSRRVFRKLGFTIMTNRSSEYLCTYKLSD